MLIIKYTKLVPKLNEQVMLVIGLIRDIGSDILDNTYIALVGDEYFGDIQCYFNEKSVVGKLSKGKNNCYRKMFWSNDECTNK